MAPAKINKESTKRQSTFEKSIKRLEEIVEQLEEGSVPLENAVKLFEEGIQLSKSCLEKLNQAELKIKKISKDLDGNFSLSEENYERE